MKLANGYEIEPERYQRFDEKMHMIYRHMWDESLPTYKQMFYTNIMDHIKENKEGYTRFDFAFVKSAWTVYKKFPMAFSWTGSDQNLGDFYGTEWTKKPHKIDNIPVLTRKVKKAAKFFGAALVGITNIDKKWIYNSGMNMGALSKKDMMKNAMRKGESSKPPFDQEISLPNGISNAIVMAIEMDPIGIATAPAQPASAAAANGYSRMAFTLACIGELIRNLGYTAIQCGNDTAISIPLAVDAGLGALGRIGLLVTKKYGPRVRLCKVFTNMPLEHDQPDLDFITKVDNICKECTKCADACETGAISSDSEKSFSAPTPSNNPGVKKWFVDVEKCFEYWVENSGDCGKCIAACPLSKIQREISPTEFWNS